MTIIQEIYNWSKGLPVWQQDAIARLYTSRELDAVDIDDLYLLAKAEVGIVDPKCKVPKILDDSQVAAPTDPKRIVQLLEIKDISNVNALAVGSRLPIAPTGLTVIYGENGAGKSGYSRVLKHACRARDQREAILPNSQLDRAHAGIPSATFQVMIDGESAELPWVYRNAAPDPLSEIAIFDTHCARAYIDNHGDYAYRPYGLDILESLVGVCTKLKALASKEKADNTPSNAAYSAIANQQTVVGRALLGIPQETKAYTIETLGTLSTDEIERLSLLTKVLSEADPKQKAQAIRQKAGRLTELKQRIDTTTLLVDDAKVISLRDLIQASKTTKAAAELAASDFRSTSGQLEGTGGEEWKALFEAARVFANISHHQHKLESLPRDSLCPLCQNVLGDEGANRLGRFDSFVRQTAETLAKKARAEAEAAYRSFQTANIDLQLGTTLLEELKEIDPDLEVKIIAFQSALSLRQKQAMEASASKLDWGQIQSLPDDPCLRLEQYILAMSEQAKSLTATADEKTKASMIQEKLELDARKRLSEIKTAVLDVIAKHELCSKLQICINGMDTRTISRKSTELSRTMASQELADALNAELKSLKVHELYVGMKPESSAGKTQFKLTLQLPGGGSPSAILSEGEQRAIAIAAFLAEIKLSKSRGGIIFDDPVSSLDHRRRWEVAERLALESKQRQVIIFTHDIYFLAILEQKIDAIGSTLAKNYIRRTALGFGVHSQDLPFDVVGTKARISQLRQILTDVQRAKKDGDDDRVRMITGFAYGRLRLAWERCVEEVLLNGVVQRFSEGISTQKLKAVLVTDEDYKQIDAGMTKSSKFEHDAASTVGRLPIPDFDELAQDIEKLEAFRVAVDKRNKQGIAARA